MIKQIPENEAISLYQCGPFVDLCRGPHIEHTGIPKGFAITQHSISSMKMKQKYRDEINTNVLKFFPSQFVANHYLFIFKFN